MIRTLTVRIANSFGFFVIRIAGARLVCFFANEDAGAPYRRTRAERDRAAETVGLLESASFPKRFIVIVRAALGG